MVEFFEVVGMLGSGIVGIFLFFGGVLSFYFSLMFKDKFSSESVVSLVVAGVGAILLTMTFEFGPFYIGVK